MTSEEHDMVSKMLVGWSKLTNVYFFVGFVMGIIVTILSFIPWL